MSIFGKKGKRTQKGRSIQTERKHLLSPKSDFFIREAYKTLRTNVSFALPDEEGCKVIVVTSSMQGEGKSITALNMAISHAMADRKVLLIDCDLRRPKLARLLQMGSKVGLSNLIVNPRLLDEAIKHTRLSGLDVILSGNVPPNPSELLGSGRMDALLEQLKEHYDYIFLDSPPVNMVTDAVVLAPKSDGVIFLVRAGRSERGAVVHAVEQLEYAKAKILGFVLNGVDVQRARYGYRKGHYRRYFRYGKYQYARGYRYGYSSTMPSPYVADILQDEDAT
ncbi:MAG: CpsD/CapB family tyrosine-protein kinase [Oscillospiraceae bacterium]|nr:CpsD/CapB family tyrosine-protein kinase [Oscillospiraceae bacterium]